MDKGRSGRGIATRTNTWTGGAPYVMAFIVTVLWSSSYVLIKWGLAEIPPLFFATVRYTLAFCILLALDIAMGTSRTGKGTWGSKQTILLVLAGLGGYTIAQGLQFVGLYYLPAITTSFLINFNPFFVLILGVWLLREGTSITQLGGLGIALLGAWAFFSQQGPMGGQAFGILIVIISGLGWACYVVIVRMLQRSGNVDSLRLTTATVGIGVVGMIALTVVTGQYAPLTPRGILIIVWLATANTVLAFFIWNWCLKSIPAYELTVFQDLMLVETAIFAFVFLQEAITPLMVGGMALVTIGVLVVQLRASRGMPRLPKSLP